MVLDEVVTARYALDGKKQFGILSSDESKVTTSTHSPPSFKLTKAYQALPKDDWNKSL